MIIGVFKYINETMFLRTAEMEKSHIVILPFPSSGHINPCLHLAKLLHCKGLFITFINTESSRRSMLNSEGTESLDNFTNFRFETIEDGILMSLPDGDQSVAASSMTTYDNCAEPLKSLMLKIESESGVPKITSIVYNWLMSFALDVAEELNIRAFVFMSMSACGFMVDLSLSNLADKGFLPLKDKSYLTEEYLAMTVVDFIPGMKDIRLKDLSSSIRTTGGNDQFLNNTIYVSKKALRAQALIINAFDSLEFDVLDALSSMVTNVFSIGPLHKLLTEVTANDYKSRLPTLNQLKEDHGCMKWLHKQNTGSVIYVSFGSIRTLSNVQLLEFAWGLADSNHPFLLVVRPDILNEEKAVLPYDFIEETKDRSCITSWCPQAEVLSHVSIGGFLTHCGWNSILESICCGVPMICWPGFADQYVNARYICKEWGIGMESEEVNREEVSYIVKELMEGDRREEMMRNALQWKGKAKKTTMQGGSSSKNFEKLVECMSLLKW